MLFSRDFLIYFSHVADVLDRDSTVWTASAWNDNGFEGKSEDPSRILRTDWFVGFGWLLSRALFYDELFENWPHTHWDHWMRDPETNKNRQTLFPEVPRNYHIGIFGTHSDYDLYQTYFEKINMYKGPAVGFDSVPELLQDRYEARLRGMIEGATAIEKLEDLKTFENRILTIYVEAKLMKRGPKLQVYDELARRIGVWHSSGGMTPRGSYKGVVQLRERSNVLLIIPMSCAFAALKPTSAHLFTHDELPSSAPDDQEFDDRGSVVRGAPPFALTGGIAPLGQTCTDACAKLRHKGKHFECDDRGFPWLNNCHQLERAFQCTSCVASTGPDQPALDLGEDLSEPTSKVGVCLWTSLGDSKCSASHRKTRRLCPCKEI
eukprot:c20396_g2_i2.p1 GENE.c20396_g2_i2~~c20396_g2_i2.p1  ORF type:complete len:377 (+),score=78.84 c20396_g2_i2:2301-3431(+)